MTPTQRQAHLLVWLVLAPVLALMLLIALLTDPLTVEAVVDESAEGRPAVQPFDEEASP